MHASTPDRAKWLCTYDARRVVNMRRGTFMYQARKRGVRYTAGTRIWDGYSWSIEDLERLFNVKINIQKL